MDVKTVVELISNVGFPIVACIALFWYIVYNRKNSKCDKHDDADE